MHGQHDPGVLPVGDEEVAPVQRRRCQPDDDLAVGGLGLGDILEMELSRATQLAQDDRLHRVDTSVGRGTGASRAYRERGSVRVAGRVTVDGPRRDSESSSSGRGSAASGRPRASAAPASRERSSLVGAEPELPVRPPAALEGVLLGTRDPDEHRAPVGRQARRPRDRPAARGRGDGDRSRSPRGVETDGGAEPFDHLVIATGSDGTLARRPRRARRG